VTHPQWRRGCHITQQSIGNRHQTVREASEGEPCLTQHELQQQQRR
jgi:hypothetical protein